MKRIKLFLSTILVFIAALAIPLSNDASAAGASMYFAPTNVIVAGSTYSVQVRVNTAGSTADAVEADFTYPTSLLSYTNTDLTGSAFGVTASVTGGSGLVSIQLGATPPYVTGDALVGTVNFQVLSKSPATLAFQNTSQLLNSGVNFLSTKSNIVTLQPVYRLANWITHERLFTLSAAERDNAVAHIPGWVYEGVSFNTVPSTTTGAVPIYRLANWITHERLFTLSAAERDNAVAHIPGWVYEGIAFYALPSAATGTVPVYRLANWITHERLFTINPAERDNAVAHIPGWVYEGIAFYISP